MTPYRRISGKALLDETVRSGRRIRSGAILFVFKENNKEGLGFCIKIPKSSGNSVKRNKMRRIIRENCRLALDGASPGLNVVINWKGKIEPDSFAAAAAGTRTLIKEMLKKC